MRDLCHFIHPLIAEGSLLKLSTFPIFSSLSTLSTSSTCSIGYSLNIVVTVNISRNFPWLTLSFNLVYSSCVIWLHPAPSLLGPFGTLLSQSPISGSSEGSVIVRRN